MPLLRFDTEGFVDICFHCGQQSTVRFDLGSAKAKDGPYHLLEGMTLTVRVDDEDGGPGHVETVVFARGDFARFDAISCDELVGKLDRSLAHATAVNDFGGALILSKTAGPQSSIEIIDGDARLPLGFALYGPSGFHVGAARPVLGFSNLPDARYPDHPTHPGEPPSPQMIQLRRCACGAIGHYVVRNDARPEHHDFERDYQTAHRRAVNSLARHLHGIGHIDPECRAFYRGRDYFATGDYHPDHERRGRVELGAHDDILRYLGGAPGKDDPHRAAARAIEQFAAARRRSP